MPTLKGKVTDTGGKAMSGALVVVDGRSATTGRLGNYSLTVYIGLRLATFSKAGYETVQKSVIASAGTNRLDAAMPKVGVAFGQITWD
jgi:hypothetical protein